MKVYVASSWRNWRQPYIVKDLRNAGHEVYDFKNPPNGMTEPVFELIDKGWKKWTPQQYISALNHPQAIETFTCHVKAIHWADVTLMVQPCGVSSGIELGFAAGLGKETATFVDEGEPELMLKVGGKFFVSITGILQWLKELENKDDRSALARSISAVEGITG